jgi:hypothetical protein
MRERSSAVMWAAALLVGGTALLAGFIDSRVRHHNTLFQISILVAILAFFLIGLAGSVGSADTRTSGRTSFRRHGDEGPKPA